MKWLAFLSLALFSPQAQAHTGVFQLPAFVEPGFFSLGVNPEFTMTANRTGLGVNFMYTHGISDLINVTGILGTGSGKKQFRTGTTVALDFFPDVGSQPGIGLGVNALYYRLDSGVEFELGGTPYFHKSFELNGVVFDPYLGFPIGFVFSDEQDPRFQTGFTIGSHFEVNPHIRVPLELGLSIHQGETYASTGLLYNY